MSERTEDPALVSVCARPERIAEPYLEWFGYPLKTAMCLYVVTLPSGIE